VAVIMVAIFVLSTPLGSLIGILINSSYNETSTNTLLVTGVLDSICAGILIYDALVNMIGAYVQSSSFRKQSALAKIMQVSAFWLGAGIMAYIGQYA
jgi:zinc transporter 1/2/3